MLASWLRRVSWANAVGANGPVLLPGHLLDLAYHLGPHVIVQAPLPRGQLHQDVGKGLVGKIEALFLRPPHYQAVERLPRELSIRI